MHIHIPHIYYDNKNTVLAYLEKGTSLSSTIVLVM